MKTVLLGLLCLACTNVFALNFGKKIPSHPFVQYQAEHGIQKFECNYDLTDPKEKRQKLQQALRFEESILDQVLIENDKFDRLASGNSEVISNTRKVLGLEKQLEKHRKVALELLSFSETLSEYISWLKS